MEKYKRTLGIRNGQFYADLESVEKAAKNPHKKVIKERVTEKRSS
jgi:hypothetical protein